MKKILHINYYLLAIAWGLMLNNKLFLAMIVAYASDYLLYLYIRRRNIWRITTLFLITNILGVVMLRLSTLTSSHPYLPLFYVAVSLNVALLNDFLLGIRMKLIYPSYLMILLCAVFFITVALLVPVSMYEYFGMINIYLLIVLIFSPYILLNTYCLIKKELCNNHIRMQLLKNKG